MKKIVDLMKTVFADNSTDLNTNNCSNINFWCPSGMIPVNICN